MLAPGNQARLSITSMEGNSAIEAITLGINGAAEYRIYIDGTFISGCMGINYIGFALLRQYREYWGIKRYLLSGWIAGGIMLAYSLVKISACRFL